MNTLPKDHPVRLRTTLLLCASLTLFGCKTTSAQPDESPTETQTEVVAIPGECGQCIAVPTGPRDVLFDPDVKRAKLYFEDAGNVTKYTAYVEAAALPAWVLQVANEKLGPGEDLEWEIEYYGADKQVFEVKRQTDDGVRKISVGEDRTVFYVDAFIDVAELPEPVASRVKQFTGLEVSEAVRKEYQDGTTRYLIHGQLQGQRHRLFLAEDGELISHTRAVPAVVEVPVDTVE